MSDSSTTHNISDRVKDIPGGEHLLMCYSCGTCTSICMVQTKQDETYNPRRLIREAVFDLTHEAFADHTTWLCTACDICYPACPQKIHISGVINAVKTLAVEAGHKTIFKTAVVDAQTCVACGLCVKVCPYEAITLVDTKVPFRGMIPIATVDAGKCMACGLCAASCRSTSIALAEDTTDAQVIADIWAHSPKAGGAR